MKKIIIFSSLFIVSNATAQTCIPKPDCADMGYTKTSCDGAYLKCPFDTSKLACLSNTEQLCLVGYIYYSDKTCSPIIYSNKIPIGIVVKSNKLVMSLGIANIDWTNNALDIGELTNYTSDTNVKTDYNGKANTLAIVSAHQRENAGDNAAIHCNSYSTEGTSAGDWYLPAAGELYNYVYATYMTLNMTYNNILDGNLNEGVYFWSSSEYNNNYAWTIGIQNGEIIDSSKSIDHYAMCFMEI